MAKQNSVNLDITNNADGFSIAGGSTSRTLGVSGGYCDSNNQYGGTPTPEGRHSESGFTTLYNGSSLTVSSLSVSAGDYLSFLAIGQAPPFPPGTHNVTIRINNQSDANAVIDTITFQQV
jgi:hypothetical protein